MLWSVFEVTITKLT